LRDVKHLVRAGADQLIFGWLTPDNRVDREGMKRMIEAAEGTPCCFHRVFDMTRDLDEALDDLMSLGFIRVLTSGGAATVDQAFPVLERLQARAGHDFAILAGGGVREANCQELARRGLREIHFSFRQPSSTPGYGGVDDFQPLPERISAIRRLTSS
jgi:copper homeostasis protein